MSDRFVGIAPSSAPMFIAAQLVGRWRPQDYAGDLAISTVRWETAGKARSFAL